MKFKKLAAVVLALAVAVGGVHIASRAIYGTSCTVNTTWKGTVNDEFQGKVEASIKEAETLGCTLRVDLTTEGGAVSNMLEIVRQMELAKARGLVIEMHGRQLVASAGTVIFGAGTKGKRFVSPLTLIIVHPIKGGGSCYDLTNIPKAGDKKMVFTMFGPTEIEITEEQAETARFYITSFYEQLGRYSNKLPDCKKSYTGGEKVAIELGIADAIDN